LATPAFILASASQSRQSILRRAGIDFTAEPADIDEAAIKTSMGEKGAKPSEIALALAQQKAIKVSKANPSALVLGGDQILVCNGVLFDKPPDLTAAAAHLHSLSGHWHNLETALVFAQDGKVVWHHNAVATLKMRTLSKAFIGTYLGQVGQAALSSVGAYQLEGLGAQLFDQIEGDFFTILGLPLLPVLQQLRQRNMIMT